MLMIWSSGCDRGCTEISSSVWFFALDLNGGGLTVRALGVDLLRDLGIGVVGVLNEGSLRSRGAREESTGEAGRKDIVNTLIC